MYVDGQRFYAQGIGYSPVPVDAGMLSSLLLGDGVVYIFFVVNLSVAEFVVL